MGDGRRYYTVPGRGPVIRVGPKTPPPVCEEASSIFGRIGTSGFGRSTFWEEAPSYIWRINISHPFPLPTLGSAFSIYSLPLSMGARNVEMWKLHFLSGERLWILGHKNGDNGCILIMATRLIVWIKIEHSGLFCPICLNILFLSPHTIWSKTMQRTYIYNSDSGGKKLQEI